MKINFNLKIDEEFKNLIPSLTEEEFNGLKDSILSEGCRDPLVLWDTIILDGHNRYKICMENNVIFKRVEKNFDSREQAKIWILENQLGRRNINAAQRIDLTDKLEGEKEKENARKRMLSGKKDPSAILRNGKGSASRLARRAKVGSRTYEKGIKVKREDPALWNDCLDGNKSINEAEKELKKKKQDKEKEQRRKEKEEIGKSIVLTDKDIDFRLGDFREVLKDIPDGSIDLIITDPPYGKEYLGLYEDLSKLAKRVLKKNGFLISYAGGFNLPDTMKNLGSNLDYYWTCILIFGGCHDKVVARNVTTGWKPLLIYQNGLKKTLESFSDVIHGSGYAKENHDWEQSAGELSTLIDVFSKPGDCILDPMAGSGTTLLMSRKLKRKCIGVELEQSHYNLAKKRIQDELG